MPETTSGAALESLVREIQNHPVNTNVFFERFKEERLTSTQLRHFVGQYHYFCKHFVKVLEGLLFRTPIDELDMRVELTKTLYSELGAGDSTRAHLALLTNFARAVGLGEQDLKATEPTEGVRSYLHVLHQLFIESDYLTALGAEMAVEITAASEFRYLYPGLQHYAMFSEQDLTFFRLHLEEEICHGTWLMDAVRRTAHSPHDLESVASGARHTADAWHHFWLGMHDTIFDSSAAKRESTSAPSSARS
jgi:pyrroloquinoline quinone (PQQ) biosynthesis protein C